MAKIYLTANIYNIEWMPRGLDCNSPKLLITESSMMTPKLILWSNEGEDELTVWRDQEWKGLTTPLYGTATWGTNPSDGSCFVATCTDLGQVVILDLQAPSQTNLLHDVSFQCCLHY